MSLIVDIKKDFGSFRLQVAFESGKEIVGLLGASGCGKSMTLRCIAGIVTPDSGYISLNGRVLFDSKKHINLSPQKRKTGLLFQEYALFPNMTVLQNVLTGLRHSDLDRRTQLARANEMLEKMQLKDLADRRPWQLSGGQKQRAALARMLVNQPEMFMLDEPFSALDSHLRWKTEREVLELARNFDGPVLMVSHSRDEIYHMCDCVLVYNNGFIDRAGKRSELFHDPQTVQSALLTGCKNIAYAQAAGAGKVYIPAWNITLSVQPPVAESFSAVGIHAHFLRQSDGENCFDGVVEQIVEGPLDALVFVRPNGAERAICWAAETSACRKLARGAAVRLCIEPKDILFLEGEMIGE
ncbi:MAG TPA: ATP-binding cassette domain-containing protein [Candidatus Agathobaculum merdigallinarum]|nr:ATP-binding cassette domain-containing protein [Candidatus Agathobaculum merdigallinarum]